MTKSITYLVVLCLTWGSITTARAESASSETLRPMMRQNFATVLELQEYAASSERLRDQKNYGEIVRLIDRLAGIAHVLPQVTTDRPGLAAMAAVYSEYLADLKAVMKTGNPVYLRNRIRTAAGFCFECHTSAATDQSFQDTDKRVEALKLTPFQKAEFLAATRQFDGALDVYENLLGAGPTRPAQSTELVRAVRNALILAVRVKQDPKLAEDILKRVEKREDLSAFFRGQIGAWKKDVSDWKKDRPLDPGAPAVSWLEKARRLVEHARKLQAYPADHAGDVSYLRAIAFTHEVLARRTDQAQKAESFYLLGAAHAVLEDPLLWNLDDYYFEACVSTLPHTPMARQCFDRWLQETTFSYTGSLGTDMPREASVKLDRLRQLAQ